MLAIAIPRLIYSPRSESMTGWAASVEASAELVTAAAWTTERLSNSIDALQAFVDIQHRLTNLTRLGFGPQAFMTPAQASFGRGSVAAEAAEVQPIDLRAAATQLCMLLAVREVKIFFARSPLAPF